MNFSWHCQSKYYTKVKQERKTLFKAVAIEEARTQPGLTSTEQKWEVF